MRDSTKSKLAAISTATLTTVLFKRGLRNTFIANVHRIQSGDVPNMVGPAYTLRYIPAREDLDHIGVFEDRSHPQRKGVEECPPGHIFVIDSRRNASAASAGNILVTRLWKRGVAGIVTDGGFRDTPEIAAMLNVPLACGEVPVFPGDILVGDGEGVAVIPAAIADAVADEALEQTVFEDFVQEKVNEGRGIFGLYPPTPETREEFAKWRAAAKR
jgi:regulator of RNase E activity RraA